MKEACEKEDSDAVVTILPFIDDKVLMQLRDANPKIKHPGCWGYFSGAIKVGEKPTEAARRELQEEIGYDPGSMATLGRLCITELDNLIAYVYSCSITVPLEKLVLTEGLDMGLMTEKEILSGQIYSKTMKKNFPVADTVFIRKALELALDARKKIAS